MENSQSVPEVSVPAKTYRTIVAGPFTQAITCPWCGQQGSMVWEKTQAGQQVVSLSGFYERLARKRPHDIETVCDRCDRAQRVKS